MHIKPIVLTVCGILALGVGAVGIALPILPTTPFVLVAAACFGGSNEKLYKKILATKYFGEYIHNYKEKSGVSIAVKAQSIAFLWCTLAISAFVFKNEIAFILLPIVGVAVTAHILLLKNKTT